MALAACCPVGSLMAVSGRVSALRAASDSAAMPKEPHSEEPMEEEEEEDTAVQLMNNPAVLAALQGRLGGLGSPAGYIEVSRQGGPNGPTC